MAGELGSCGIAACGAPLTEQSPMDLYYKKRVCQPCFNNTWEQAKTHGFGEWFESNYEKSDYPAEFWRSVGAFVDLSKTELRLKS